MKKLFLLPLIVFLGILESSSTFASQTLCTKKFLTTKQLVALVKPSVAIVYANGQGSAFVVGQGEKNTYLITNRHVVADNRYVKIKWEDGSLDKAAVIARAKK